jgi:hypothetical protein
MSKFALQLAQNTKRFIPLLSASAALLLSQGQARAVLTYNIFESAGNVVVQSSGSLDLTGATLFTGAPPLLFGTCPSDGLIDSFSATICSGPAGPVTQYSISGPQSFVGFVTLLFASSPSGITTKISSAGGIGLLGLPSSYVSGTSILSSSTFENKTLLSLGFGNNSGLIGTWSLTGTSETIQVFLGPPSPSGAAVPGPLPLLGAGAAFAWSRRLRRRITAPGIKPPQT